MSKPFYVKFETPPAISDAAYEALQVASRTGQVRKGTNETTKAIERGIAKLVVVAEDVEPPEVVAHLPILCGERKIPYVFVPTKEKLGAAIGIDVPAAAACIVKEGDAANLVKEIVGRIEELQRGKQ
ncbi:MAG: 50S ribosomal protein L7Ae [Candidatus Bathyarchaeota archaeon]|jgi:large subunit ribosomal protein L7Ae|nr:50S ribosomal protein L7Ae [Candidatus Bathyarchaeota archaeon]